MIIRPRRSVLYMPGSNPRALQKARTLPADCLILDLEDSVAPAAKESARTQVVEAVSEGGYGNRELVVRVNGLDTQWWRDDLAAFVGHSIDGVLFPKIETVDQLQQAAAGMATAGLAEHVALWIMAETPLCMLNIASIASSNSRLKVIVMGTSDLAKDLRARHTPDRIGFYASLGLCVLAARASGQDILDGVAIDLDDDAGFINACQQGRDMGFDGKTLIHPKQIIAANDTFGPDQQEIVHAREIILAWEKASKDGQGVTVVNGRLVEQLHMEEAQRTLALAEAIAALESVAEG